MFKLMVNILRYKYSLNIKPISKSSIIKLLLNKNVFVFFITCHAQLRSIFVNMLYKINAKKNHELDVTCMFAQSVKHYVR